MARTNVDDAAQLTVADVVHKHFTTLSATVSVSDVRAWFAASPHRRMALLADDGRYAGSLTVHDLDGEGDPLAPAAQYAQQGPTVAPEASAELGYELAMRTDTRRVPVVDADGMLLGIVAITADEAGFCGTT
ncbi:MAG: CBS domain-containing protein [Solirubrobacteraceae bacterium]